MNQSIDAIYDGTVLRPIVALPLEPNTRVRITFEAISKPPATPSSFLQTARSLNLDGPIDWSANLDNYLFGDNDRPK